jgi:hypothetical protein
MESAFEQLGFFETLLDVETGKQVGTRPLPNGLPADRKVGHEGGIEFTQYIDFTVQVGHKIKRIKLRAPRKYYSIIFPLCGRMKDKVCPPIA